MFTELDKIRKRRAEWIELINKTLESVTNQLIQMGAEKIILFGSIAENDIRYGSDIDLVVVMPDTLTSREWRKKIYTHVDRDIGCDFFVYGLSTFEKKKNVSIIIKTALETGKVIYEK